MVDDDMKVSEQFKAGEVGEHEDQLGMNIPPSIS